MASGTLKRLEEVTRCAHCSQTYRDPRLLRCGHSFCRVCIGELLMMKSITCLRCLRQSHVPSGDPSSLIKNFALMGLIDSNQNAYSDPYLRCHDCKIYEQREAVEHCYTCQVSLCSLCSEWHVNKNHVIKGIDSYESESMDIRDRTSQSLLNRTDAKKEQIAQRLQLTATQTHRVKSASQKIRSDINHAFIDHMRQLQEARDALIEQCNQREEFLLGKLKTVNGYTHDFLDSISKIGKNLTLSNGKRLRGDALRNHIALCHELETLIQDDIDVDILKEISSFAESFEFQSTEPQSIGGIHRADVGWRARIDKVVDEHGSISCITATPDGRVAIGYSMNKGGWSFFNPDGTEERPESLQGVYVRSIAILPDGQCAMLNLQNTLSLYSKLFEELPLTFETWSSDDGGVGRICVDEQCFLYVSYKKVKKIQVFAPMGGAPLKEITFTGIEPIDVKVSSSGVILLISWRKIKLLDQTGDVRGELNHTISDELIVADICSDETLIVAFISQEIGKDYLTVRRYSQDAGLTLMETAFENQPIDVCPKPFYCIRELVTGEIAFCTKSKLYLFQYHSGEVNDEGFADFGVQT